MKKLIALLIAAAILASLSTFALAADIFAPKCPFDDVSADDYCYNAVVWAYENGITVGTSDHTFSPDATCTRAQMITFLYRYHQMVQKGTVGATLTVNRKVFALSEEDAAALRSLIHADCWSQTEYAEYDPAYILSLDGMEYRFEATADAYNGFNVLQGDEYGGRMGASPEAANTLRQIFEIMGKYATYEPVQ